MMYFLKQLETQFFNSIALYNGPEGAELPQDEPLWPRLEATQAPVGEGEALHELSDMTDTMNTWFDRHIQGFWELDAALDIAERWRAAEQIAPTQEEITQILWREWLDSETIELTDEDRRAIYIARLEAIEGGEIFHDGTEHGPRRILEGEYIREISQESGMNPDLLMDLRALDFEGAQSWENEEIMGNYENLTQDLQRIAEEEWLDLSELSAEEFIEIYEARQVDPMTPLERNSRWDVVDDGAGGYQFDPETPWLQTFTEGWEQVQVLSDGTYSRGWDVYAPPAWGPEAFPNYSGPAWEVDRNPWTLDGELMVREETLGTQRLAEVYENLSPEERQQIDEIMSEEAQPLQMHPIAMEGGSVEFVSNPTYEPDVNGDGVSSNEAVAYAQWHNMQLPTRAQTDAARQQAQVRGVMPTHNNQWVSTETQRQNTASQRAYLEQTIQGNWNVLVGGVTKIWAFEPGRQPGLNGWIQNLQSWESWQGYSTVHGPDYADYSQAAQFVHPLRIGSDGNLEWHA